jgi:hypothetical protein
MSMREQNSETVERGNYKIVPMVIDDELHELVSSLFDNVT